MLQGCKWIGHYTQLQYNIPAFQYTVCKAVFQFAVQIVHMKARFRHMRITCNIY